MSNEKQPETLSQALSRTIKTGAFKTYQHIAGALGRVPEYSEEMFCRWWDVMETHVHETAVEKGWWDSPEAWSLREIALENAQLTDEQVEFLRGLADRIEGRNDGEVLALIHSEVSEALEGLRHSNPQDDKLLGFSSAEAELADVVIRIMDIARRRKWNIAEAICAKAAYNKTRSYKHGGKAF